MLKEHGVKRTRVTGVLEMGVAVPVCDVKALNKLICTCKNAWDRKVCVMCTLMAIKNTSDGKNVRL